jgi:hypothetical protein
MAENGANGSNGGDRLDSWKAIAAYLNRDERTARRWERQGLPIRRVPGNRGQSVFAYKSEIDQWLTLPRETNGEDAPSVAAPEPLPRLGRRRAAQAAGIAALAVLGAGVWWASISDGEFGPLQAALTQTAIVGTTASGQEQWRYVFPDGDRVEPPQERQQNPTEQLQGLQGILAATGLRISSNEAVSSGELLLVSDEGDLQRRMAFDDVLTFGDARAYGQPWGITDYRVDAPAAQPRIAVAAHHYEWWPSMIAILDPQFRRRGTFVNAGWLERVHWLAPDRLLAAGYSESRAGGVIALLDADALNGQSPEDEGSPYFCATCGDGRPVRYVVMPRSEVNRVSGSRFNRARLQMIADRITVRTIEVPYGEADAADAVYEFDQALGFVRAAYSDRYWEAHRALEMAGKLDHTQDTCPDRNGPREILIWEPATRWQTISIN